LRGVSGRKTFGIREIGFQGSGKRIDEIVAVLTEQDNIDATSAFKNVVCKNASATLMRELSTFLGSLWI